MAGWPGRRQDWASKRLGSLARWWQGRRECGREWRQEAVGAGGQARVGLIAAAGKDEMPALSTDFVDNELFGRRKRDAASMQM